LFDLLNNPQLEDQGAYPPYDIVRTGADTYRIAVAIAGFTPDEITVTSQQNLLTVEGRKANEDNQQYLHRGISARAFTRRFNLEDHVEVEQANYDNGLLQIDLVRKIPEAMKPRKIAVGSGSTRPKERTGTGRFCLLLEPPLQYDGGKDASCKDLFGGD
jgi:molecular chaperone IbpA